MLATAYGCTNGAKVSLFNLALFIFRQLTYIIIVIIIAILIILIIITIITITIIIDQIEIIDKLPFHPKKKLKLYQQWV